MQLQTKIIFHLLENSSKPEKHAPHIPHLLPGVLGVAEARASQSVGSPPEVAEARASQAAGALHPVPGARARDFTPMDPILSSIAAPRPEL